MNHRSLPIDGVDEVADIDSLAGRLFWDAPLSSLIVDSDGTVIHANARTESVFGWSPRELVGRSVEVLVPTMSRKQHVVDRLAYVRGSTTRLRAMGRGRELGAVRRDGTEIVVELQISELATRRGVYFMIMARDVTEQRRDAERLARANAELRERAAAYVKLDREKNAVLGMVAHDLRTPIAVIAGYGELLTSLPPSEPLRDHSEIVGVIERAAKMMRRIVDDLLDWSAIEAGTLRLARRSVDPGAVAADAVALVGLAADRQGIDLRLEHEPGLPSTDLDPERISQVLGNLLGNALKHSPSGQTVCVRVARSGDDSVEYAVSDHGGGIAREDLSHIFHPFETGANRTVNGERSTGLGLAIVKRIVDAHGGTVGVESEPGLGSTFWVKLPIHAPRESDDALRASEK